MGIFVCDSIGDNNLDKKGIASLIANYGLVISRQTLPMTMGHSLETTSHCCGGAL